MLVHGTRTKPLLDEAATVDEAITSRRSVQRLPARSGPRSDDPRNPRQFASWSAVRHQHAAVARLQRSGETKERLSRAILTIRPSRRGGEGRVQNITPTSSSSLNSPPPRCRLCAFTTISVSASATLTRCGRSTIATSSSSTRPVGMIFTIDRSRTRAPWSMAGACSGRTIMVARARARGLHTCPAGRIRSLSPADQAGPRHLRRGRSFVCGMAFGYEDASKPENTLRTDRAPLDEWATFLR